MRKKALVILSRYLWPVDGGRKESLNHYLKELYDNYNYEITLLCFLEASQCLNKQDKPYYISEIKVLNDVHITEKIKNLIWHSLIKDNWPFQCSLYYSKDNEQSIKKYIEQLKPQLIFTEMIRTCTYYNVFKDSGALKLANLDDLLSVRYQRQTKSKNSKANVAGAYSEKLPEWIKKITSSDAIKNMILRMEAKRCYIWERNYYRFFDYVLMTSNVERDILNSEMNDHKAKTLTVGVDCDYYSADIPLEKDPIGLAYVGNFNVAANIDTLDMIANQILPLIISDYKFYVIGKCPDEIKNRYIDNKKIIFCGRVDDLRAYVKKAQIFLSPIAYGTGIKTKIVEAMAMGIPVVTNSVGAEGIHATNGEEIIVYDDYNQIANAVDWLFDNRIIADRIGKSAQIFANKNFRWEKVFKIYQEMNL